MTRFTRKSIEGAGIGLRTCHYREILGSRPPVAWFEALADNYLGDGGMPLLHLEQVREHYPMTLHGVGMSLGSTDPLDQGYLRRLGRLIGRIEPAWVSEHLAWISFGGSYLHELLPLPYTQEALEHVAGRISQAQDALGLPLLIENPSSYLVFRGEQMSEPEFLRELVRRTGCGILLDVNNAYVSAMNHGWDPSAYINDLPATAIREIHLAGYEEHENYLFDTHGHRVHPPVWDLYAHAIEVLGPVPTLIEWDTDIPPLETLRDEAGKAQQHLERRRRRAA
jgi:uncharacterized protein (UPF0276 family)